MAQHRGGDALGQRFHQIDVAGGDQLAHRAGDEVIGQRVLDRARLGGWRPDRHRDADPNGLRRVPLMRKDPDAGGKNKVADEDEIGSFRDGFRWCGRAAHPRVMTLGCAPGKPIANGSADAL